MPANISPAARYLAASRNVDLSGVKGSGKHGMFTKTDVLVALGLATAAPSAAVTNPIIITSSVAANSPPIAQMPSKSAVGIATTTTEPVNSRYVDVPNTNMRKIIAKRLSESKSTVPHFYMEMDANLDSIMRLRQQLKKDFDVAVSVNDLVIKAAALALRDVPEANMRWDSKANAVVVNGGIDISVAVATPTGLITPILTNAAGRGLVDINRTVKDLATRAKEGKLKPEEFQGGSFSISNLGMFGISSFSAVINPPQACILAVGSGIGRVVPSRSIVDGKEVIRPKLTTVTTVQLSADRRVMTEALAGIYLQAFKHYLSNAQAIVL